MRLDLHSAAILPWIEGAKGTPLLHRIGAAASELGRKPPRHPAVRVVVQGGLTVLVLAFLVYTVLSQWHELRDHNVHFHAGWLAAAVPALLVFTCATGLGWVWSLRMLDQRPNPTRAQMVWGKSLLARYVPGGVLFVVTRVVLNEREGVPRRVTVTAMAYETGLQFASAATFGAWVLFAHPGRTGTWLGLGAAISVFLALGCMHPRVFEPLINRALRSFGRREAPHLLAPRQVLALFAYYCGTWVVMGVAMVCVTRAIVPLGAPDWPVVASAQALAFCAALLSVVFPGGLGIRDGAFAWAMRTALPGDSFAIGVAIALTARIGFVATEALYAAAVTLASRQAPRKATAPATSA